MRAISPTWMSHTRLAVAVLVLAVGSMFGGHVAKAQEADESHPVASNSEQQSDVAEEDHRDFMKPPLAFEPLLFGFTLILFGLFVLGMRVTVWKPLIKGLDAREARIVKAENDARAAKIEVEKLAAHAEKRMAEAQTQVAEILSQAEQDAQRIKREALDAIAAARADALRELDQRVEQQVSLATEHVAGRRL